MILGVFATFSTIFISRFFSSLPVFLCQMCRFLCQLFASKTVVLPFKNRTFLLFFDMKIPTCLFKDKSVFCWLNSNVLNLISGPLVGLMNISAAGESRVRMSELVRNQLHILCLLIKLSNTTGYWDLQDGMFNKKLCKKLEELSIDNPVRIMVY